MKKEDFSTETMEHNFIPEGYLDNENGPKHPENPDKLEHPEHPEHPKHPEHPEHPKPSKDPITIIVNGVDKNLPIETKKISYEELVILAYGSYDSSDRIVYTVVYSKGPLENKKGTLVKGEVVFVKEGMVFNVGRSDKS